MITVQSSRAVIVGLLTSSFILFLIAMLTAGHSDVPWLPEKTTMPRPTATLFLLLASITGLAQPPAPPADLPAFEAVTIKPPDPTAARRLAGFYGKPGGRVFCGGQVKMLVQYAFNLQDYQVTGGPDWIGSQWFEVNAVPPGDSPTRNIKVANADPTPEQRLMLQRLLRDRFGLKYHMETKEGEVYILTRGTKELQLKPPKNPEADPRALVFMPSGVSVANKVAAGPVVANGDAADVVGYNTTTDYLARRLERYLQLPVLNQTGISGAYDFDVREASEVNQDPRTVMLSVVDRLGLTIKRGRGPIQTLVIDHIDQPTDN